MRLGTWVLDFSLVPRLVRLDVVGSSAVPCLSGVVSRAYDGSSTIVFVVGGFEDLALMYFDFGSAALRTSIDQ